MTRSSDGGDEHINVIDPEEDDTNSVGFEFPYDTVEEDDTNSAGFEFPNDTVEDEDPIRDSGSNEGNGFGGQLFTNLVDSKNNEQSVNEGQRNNELHYFKILERLEALCQQVEQRKDQLLEQDQQQEQNDIDELFEEAKNKVKNGNVNLKFKYHTLLEFAAFFSKDEIIQHLLTNHLEKLKEEPEQLGGAIEYAAKNGHDKALRLLLNQTAVLNTVINKTPNKLGDATYWAAKNGHDKALGRLLNQTAILNTLINKTPNKLGDAIYYAATKGPIEALKRSVTKDILEKLRYHSKKSQEAFNNIKKSLTYLNTDKDVITQVKEIVDKALKTIAEIEQYPAVLEELHRLSRENQADQAAINRKFAEARKLVTNNNVHYRFPFYSENLIGLAIEFNNTDTIKHLLANHLDSLISAAKKGSNNVLKLLLKSSSALNKIIANNCAFLSDTIKNAAINHHYLTLELLLRNDKIINAIIKSSRKDNLKDALEDGFEGNKYELDLIVATRKEIVKNRNIITLGIASIVGTPVGGYGFIAMILASRIQIVKKRISLVVNCFLPIFNTINKLLMKISPKLDLNNLVKLLTNPKIEVLIVGAIAMLGAITSALGVGTIAHKAQGGTILGR